jgi:hypothetical protein
MRSLLMLSRYRNRRLRADAGLVPAALLFFSLAFVSVIGGNGLLALCLLPAGFALDLARVEVSRAAVSEESSDAA